MEQSLDPTLVFVKVAQLGSFTKAAELLKLPKSSVSRAVKFLEEESGTKLLMRSTRSLTLTASGRAFFDTCLLPIQSLEEARRSLQGSDSMITGVVRITAPEDLGTKVISPIIGRLVKKHAGLSFEIVYTDEVVDLVKGGFDLAVRLGRLAPSRFKTRKAGDVTLIAVASPSYLKQIALPKRPADLINLTCLTNASAAIRSKWTFKSKASTESVAIQAKVMANQMTSIVNIALEGAGVAFVPYYLCRELIAEKKLVRVLPDWQSAGIAVSLVTPYASDSSVRLKLVTGELATAIQAMLAM